jgi:beta-phosphoglucomutase
MTPRAVVFDFNGTLSQDEPVLCELFTALFADHDRPLSAQEYFDELAGLSDPEIVRTWLGPDHPAVDEVLEERSRRYREAVADGSTVPDEIREAVRYAAERVPVGIVSGAARSEIESVLAGAGIASSIAVIVAAAAVERGKPHPDGYARAASLLEVEPAAIVSFEDT